MSSLLDAAIKGGSCRNAIDAKDRIKYGRILSQTRHNSPEAAKARAERKRQKNHSRRFNHL